MSPNGKTSRHGKIPPDGKMSRNGKTICLVPAHNEGDRIGAVLDVLTRSDMIDEVVVIDDGSTDTTSEVATAFGATLITLPENLGKGAALQAGIDWAGARNTQGLSVRTYLFIDADLTSLTEKHLELLLGPSRQDSAVAMVVGIAQEGRLRVDLAQRFFPVLNGQRALSAQFVSTLPDLTPFGWGVEVLLSAWAKSLGAVSATVVLPGLSQVMKEEKNGFIAGVRQRSRMYRQILAALWQTRRLSKQARRLGAKYHVSDKDQIENSADQ